MAVNCVKYEKIDIRDYPELNEKRIMDIIAKEPSILGLGDLVFEESSHIPRFEMVLQDGNNTQIFKVKIQLGEIDSSHIVKALEFWDGTWARTPQYKYYAVIIAENIENHFLDTINLFSGIVPLLVIKMNAIKIGDDVSLIFTKMLDLREAKQTASTVENILELAKMVSAGKCKGFLEDHEQALTKRINKLGSEKDSDFLRGQLFAYCNIITDLKEQHYYLSELYCQWNMFNRYNDEYEHIDNFISQFMDSEFKIVKKIIDEWDPLDSLSYGESDYIYNANIRDIVLQLKRKDTVKDIANIIFNIFAEYSNKNEKVSVENCMDIAGNIKNALDKIRK